MSGASISSLIVSILIIAVLAGFSEELFFRGTLQRILSQTNINIHAVVWLVAFIFSAFHLQPFGLIPRMLLGAFLGYLLIWSKSLWLPIIAHIFNNTVVVVSEYYTTNSGQTSYLDNVGGSLSSVGDYMMVIGSVILTTAGLILLYKATKASKSQPALQTN
jgi:hypothetical protein